MYIYDNSFKFFEKDINFKADKKSPIIYSYMPKLYYEDCYRNYNELIEQLKLKTEKIDINDKTIFKKKRKELENENNILTQQNNLLIQEINLLRKQLNSSNMGSFTIISFILVFIISFIISFIIFSK